MVKSRERDEVVVLPAVAADVDVARLPVAAPVKAEAEEPLGETPDSVELYLNEIARYKLLRPEEEVSLAKEIERANPTSWAMSSWRSTSRRQLRAVTLRLLRR
jgi:hypothetical protein